jgi:DNA-binding response OmpR family regulator
MQPNVAGSIGNYRDDHMEFDFSSRVVRVDATIVNLTQKEYALLALMVQHAGEIVPRVALLERVWGYSADIRTRTLDVHIRRLRKKLGGYADRYIETIFGIGYRFQPYRNTSFFQSEQGPPYQMTA